MQGEREREGGDAPVAKRREGAGTPSVGIAHVPSNGVEEDSDSDDEPVARKKTPKAM